MLALAAERGVDDERCEGLMKNQPKITRPRTPAHPDLTLPQLFALLQERAPQGWFEPSTVRMARKELDALSRAGFIDASKRGSRMTCYKMLPKEEEEK